VVSRNSVKIVVAKVYAALMLTVVLLLCATAPADAGEVLALIVSAQSNIDPLDSTLVRKLFLGLTVNHLGSRLRPVLNESDERIKELFLQNIVSMSDSNYDRYILRLSLLQGRTQPVVFKDKDRLIGEIAADPSAVGYVWAKDVAHDARVKILRVLWHD
jgi:hypothetical protein